MGKRNIFTVSALSAAMLLTGCIGGGGDDSTTTTNTTVSLSGVVQQTSGGSLQKPVSGKAGALPSFAASYDSTTFDSLFGAPLAGALVLVTDSEGNTLSGVAGADGSFDIAGLEAGGKYAVIFIDTRTMSVVGSLVQATDTTKPAQFSVNGDTSLGDIMIDPVNKRAVAEADANATIVTEDASTLDKDGDGIITSEDVTEMQAETLAAESAGTAAAGVKLEKVSIMPFMGDANTWAIAKETMMDGGGDDGHEWTDIDGTTYVYTEGERREMALRRNMSVEGPKGNTINAIKDASITYYGEQTEEVYAPGTTPGVDTATTTNNNIGYFNYTASQNGSPWGLDWSTFDPNGNNDGIQGWANYRYLDPVDDYIYEGEMEDGKISWRGMLPNNVVLGKPETISFKENWSETHPNPNGGTSTFAVDVDMNMKVTINKVDGAIVTDLTGKKLPIMRVNFEQTGGVTVTVDGTIVPEYGQDFTGKGAFYVMAKYGIDADVYTCSAAPVNNDATTDPNCSEQTWQQAYADARFGVVSPATDKAASEMPRVWAVADGSTILTNGVCNPNGLTTIPANTVCDLTPSNLELGTGTTTAMPSYDVFGTAVNGLTFTANGSSVDADVLAVRDSWLGAMAEYIDKIDRRDDGGSRSWYFIEGDEFGPKMDPKSWDSATGMAYPLIGGQAVVIETDKRQDGVEDGAALLDTDSSFRYFLADTTVTTVMRASMRQYDPNANCSDDRGNTWIGCDVDLGVTAGNGDITLADPNTNGAQQALYFNMTPPVVNTTNYKEVWLHWEETSLGSGTWEPYCASHVSVWFDMVEDDGTGAITNVVESHPVNFYMVRNATPAVTAAQMQDPTNPVFPDVATHCAQ